MGLRTKSKVKKERMSGRLLVALLGLAWLSPLLVEARPLTLLAATFHAIKSSLFRGIDFSSKDLNGFSSSPARKTGIDS